MFFRTPQLHFRTPSRWRGHWGPALCHRGETGFLEASEEASTWPKRKPERAGWLFPADWLTDSGYLNEALINVGAEQPGLVRKGALTRWRLSKVSPSALRQGKTRPQNRKRKANAMQLGASEEERTGRLAHESA